MEIEFWKKKSGVANKGQLINYFVNFGNDTYGNVFIVSNKSEYMIVSTSKFNECCDSETPTNPTM